MAAIKDAKPVAWQIAANHPVDFGLEQVEGSPFNAVFVDTEYVACNAGIFNELQVENGNDLLSRCKRRKKEQERGEYYSDSEAPRDEKKVIPCRV